MTDLAALLLAALDRAEETAREAAEWAEGPWYVERSESGVFASDRVQVVFDPRGYTGNARTHLDHVAANDPAHVLRLCAALREVVKLHRNGWNDYGLPEDDDAEHAYCVTCVHPQWPDQPSPYPCPTLAALASVWDVPGVAE